MIFVKRLVDAFPDGPCPYFVIHSANPVGARNIESYLDSWRRSLADYFSVTDPNLDAPDGAIVDGYERVGDRWKKVR